MNFLVGLNIILGVILCVIASFEGNWMAAAGWASSVLGWSNVIVLNSSNSHIIYKR